MDMNLRVLVTGCAGFMGSHIVGELIQKGYCVYGIDDFSGGSYENIYDYTNSGLNFIQQDLSDATATGEIISNIKPNVVFHLAANAREGASFFQPMNIVQRNYQAYINVLEPAIKYGLDKVILFSSMAVYGDQIPPFSEEMKRQPVDIYGINKAAMEHTTELLSEIHEFRYTILRPHNVYGVRQSLKDPYRNVIGIWMNRIMRREPMYIYGDGEQTRAFSYIKDSLPCYIKCIDSDDTNGKIINIGGKNPISINMLKRIVCHAMGVDNYNIVYLSERPGEVKNAWCTSDKSERILGYDEKTDITAGIEKMAVWAKKCGAQKWSEEKLTLWNKKAPSVWK